MLSWSPAAGLSKGRGKAMRQLPSAPQPHPRYSAGCRGKLQPVGSAVGAGGSRVLQWALFDASACPLVAVDMSSAWLQLQCLLWARILCSPMPLAPGAQGAAWACVVPLGEDQAEGLGSVLWLRYLQSVLWLQGCCEDPRPRPRAADRRILQVLHESFPQAPWGRDVRSHGFGGWVGEGGRALLALRWAEDAGGSPECRSLMKLLGWQRW